MAHPLLVAAGVLCGFRLLSRLLLGGSSKCFESLKGKHVLVTDSCQSAMLAITRRSLQEGAFVTLLSPSQDALSSARQALLISNESWGPRLICKVADVRKPVEAEDVIESSFQWRPIDILIFSYETGNRGLFDMKLEEIEKYTPSNLMAAVYIVHAAIPLMKLRSTAENRSAIVFMSSVGGLNILKGARTDSISHYALKGLAEMLRFELLQHNVGVHLVCPGSAANAVLSNEGDTCGEDKLNAKVADKLARAILEGVKNGHFLVTTGIDGFLVGVLARGCIPAESWVRGFLEFVLLLPLKLMSFFMNRSVSKHPRVKPTINQGEEAKKG